MFFRRVFSRKDSPPQSHAFSAPINGRFTESPGQSQQQKQQQLSGDVSSTSTPRKLQRRSHSDDKQSTSRALNVIQLTPLWEHIIRTGNLPVDLEVSDLFGEFTERLNDPEWQVRQHALRVLVDVLIILGKSADLYFSPLIAPLVDNLGHAAPAVRKGALDALRVYIAESAMPETVLLEIMDLGMIRTNEEPFSGRLTVGVMLSLPSLVQSTLHTPKRRHIIKAAIEGLFEKMVQITYQEIALKILLRIRDIVSAGEFYDLISYQAKKDFDILCNVYGLTGGVLSGNLRDSGIDLNIPSSTESKKSWQQQQQTSNSNLNSSYNSKSNSNSNSNSNHMTTSESNGNNGSSRSSSSSHQEIRWKITENSDYNQNVNSTDFSSDSVNKKFDNNFQNRTEVITKCPMDQPYDDTIPTGKIIMETEIKINQDTAVTMRILETDGPPHEATAEMIEESDDDDGPSNNGYDDDHHNFPILDSEADEINKELNQVLNDDDFENAGRRTPRRVRFGGEVVKMRTPDSDTVAQSDNDDHIRPIMMATIQTPPSSGRSTPQILVTPEKTNNLSIDIPSDNTKPLVPQRPRTAAINRQEMAALKSSSHNNFSSSPNASDITSTPPFSPKNITYTAAGREKSNIVRHQSASPSRRLTQRPSSCYSSGSDLASPRTPHKPIEVMHNLQRSPIISPTIKSRRNSTSQMEDYAPPVVIDSPRIVENVPILKQISVEEKASTYSTGHTDADESVIEKPQIKSWEELGIVDDDAIRELRSGDWRLRSRAIYKLEDALKSTENLAAVQPCLDSLLRTLLSSEKHPDVSEDKRRILINLITRLPLENLENRTGQIVIGLCRQGGAASNSVAKALMQRLPPAAVVLRLLSDEFLHARSSRFRENALQMVLYALMTFPSTYFDVATCVSRATQAAIDRKKRVRQAALDVLAVLGQISSPKSVMDVVNEMVKNRQDGDQLSAAVKARLSRKQLPMIRSDGTVQYGLRIPSPQSNFSIFGADVEWITAGIGSVSPTALKKRSLKMQQTYLPMNSNGKMSYNDDTNRTSMILTKEGSSSSSSSLKQQQQRQKAPHELLAIGVGVRSVSYDQQQYINHNYSNGNELHNGNGWTNKIVNSSHMEDEKNTQFIVATAIPIQMPPISNGIIRPLQTKMQSRSFPELSEVTKGSSGMTNANIPKSSMKYLSENRSFQQQQRHYQSHQHLAGEDGVGGNIMRPSKLPVTSRFPQMDNKTDMKNANNDNNNYYNNPYLNLSYNRTNSSLSKNSLITNKNGSGGNNSNGDNGSTPTSDSHGILTHQTSLAESSTPNRPVTHPALEFSMDAKRFSSMDKFKEPPSMARPNDTNLDYRNESNKYQQGIDTHAPLETEQRPISGNENKSTNSRFSSATSHQTDKSVIELTGNESDCNEGNHSGGDDTSTEDKSSNLSTNSTPTRVISNGSLRTDIKLEQNFVQNNAAPPSHTLSRTHSVSSLGAQSKTSEKMIPRPITSLSMKESGLNYDSYSVRAQSSLSVRDIQSRPQSSMIEIQSRPQSSIREVQSRPPSSIRDVQSRPQSSIRDVQYRPPSAVLYNEMVSDNLHMHTPMEPEVISSNSIDTHSDDDDDTGDEPVVDVRHQLDEIVSNLSSSRSSSKLEIQSNSDIKIGGDNISEKLYVNDLDTKSIISNESPSDDVGTDEVDRIPDAVQFQPEIRPYQRPNEFKSPMKITRPPILRRTRKISPMKTPLQQINGGLNKQKLTELYPVSLRRFDKPKEAFTNCMIQLESTNWEITMNGLQNFVRLIRHHPESLDPHIHVLAGTLARHVKNLRSQVARAACQAAGEFFVTHRKPLEQEADDLANTLLHRTADTNKFLRNDATKALESMCDQLPAPKIINLLSTRGACHPNAIVRTTTSMLLTRLVEKIGYERVFSMHKDCRDRLIVTGANLLTEGSLETRNHAKMLFKLLSPYQNYNKILFDVIPSKLYRNIEKTLKKV